MLMYVTYATWKSYGKSHMCHKMPNYLTQVLHSHIRHILVSHMGVTWDPYDTLYVPHDFATWQSYGKLIGATYCEHPWHRYDGCKCIWPLPHGSHMENLICATSRQTIWHTYCILIFGTYRFHIWKSSETNMNHMCATWLCHMTVLWEPHWCYVL